MRGEGLVSLLVCLSVFTSLFSPVCFTGFQFVMHVSAWAPNAVAKTCEQSPVMLRGSSVALAGNGRKLPMDGRLCGSCQQPTACWLRHESIIACWPSFKAVGLMFAVGVRD